MTSRRPSEVEGILEACAYDEAFASRVRVMGGRRFTITFCCNAGQLRRTKISQESHDELLPLHRRKQANPVLSQVETVVVDSEFVTVLREFTGDKIDIEVICAGGQVVALPRIIQVS